MTLLGGNSPQSDSYWPSFRFTRRKHSSHFTANISHKCLFFSYIAQWGKQKTRPGSRWVRQNSIYLRDRILNMVHTSQQHLISWYLSYTRRNMTSWWHKELINTRGPSYSGSTWSISWLLMPWLLTSSAHQHRDFDCLTWGMISSTCIMSVWGGGTICIVDTSLYYLWPIKHVMGLTRTAEPRKV